MAKRVVIHAVLILACAHRRLPDRSGVQRRSPSRQPLLDPDFELIPTGATFNSFINVLTDTDLPLWLFNSLVITTGTSIVGLLIAATVRLRVQPVQVPGSRGRPDGIARDAAHPGRHAAGPAVPARRAVQAGQQLCRHGRGPVRDRRALQHLDPQGLLRHGPDRARGGGPDRRLLPARGLLRILLPLSTPALVVVFLFNFLAAWNDYFLARILLSKEELLTWPLGLQRFQQQFQTNWTDLAASSILISVPACCCSCTRPSGSSPASPPVASRASRPPWRSRRPTGSVTPSSTRSSPTASPAASGSAARAAGGLGQRRRRSTASRAATCSASSSGSTTSTARRQRDLLQPDLPVGLEPPLPHARLRQGRPDARAATTPCAS